MLTAAQFREQVRENRERFARGERMALTVRKAKLTHLLEAFTGRRELFLSALHADLGKSEFEALSCEFYPALAALQYTRRRFWNWVSPRSVWPSLLSFPARAEIVPEPYGQALVVGAWNYPLLLALEPLIGAIAAGNPVMLKVPEAAGATARALDALISEIFSPSEAAVLGEELTLETILHERFDTIFFTGGESAGKMVAAAAARNLTPCTLELGGKSPVVVTAKADLKTAAKRIVWGKFLNAGQTCVAPDYVLVEQSVKAELLNRMADCVHAFFGPDPLTNPAYPRIVNSAHFQRLVPLLAAGRLVTGGEHNADSCKIAPTILDGITLEDPVMEREIFGPILPVLPVSSATEAAAIINRRPRPLALYLFSRSRRECRELLAHTTSGGVAVNDTVLQLMNPRLPFGGVGASGHGAYHGKYTFDTFTHYRPVMRQSSWFDLPFRYPPFPAWRTALMRFLTGNH